MASADSGFYFQVSANLLRIIGEEIVANDELAISELVKNAYDSHARNVTITIEPVSDKRVGYIRITDDGNGMSRRDFERLFMMAAYSERPEEAEGADRIPTGEKGIGRFAASRLGSQLRLITKASKSTTEALEVTFDWTKFRDKTKRFDKIKIPSREVFCDELGRNQTGTILEIDGLHDMWERGKVEKLRSALGELIDPYRKPSDFELTLNVVDSEKLSGTIVQLPPKEADLLLEFRVTADKQINRKLTANSLAKSGEKEVIKPNIDVELLKGLTGKLLYFFKRPTKDKAKGLTPGVRLYRDGVHIEPFGSPTADWLGISARRAKRAGHAHIVPSRLYGFVEISRIKHEKIRDTSSRQALIDNEAAKALVSALGEQLRFLEEQIRTGVTEPKWEEGRRKKAVKLEQARLHSLGMLSAGLGHELRQPLQVVRTQSGNITARLKELDINDSEIEESQEAIDRNIQRIDDSINYVGDLARGNVEEVDDVDLAEHLRQDTRFFENQCRAKGIELVVSAPESQPARISRTGFSMVLLNLWTNAVEALDEMQEEHERRITITLKKVRTDNVLEVTDNGPGISEKVRKKLFKEFETEKTGGMGIGLYTCSMIVRAHDGEITYDTRIGLGTTFHVRLPNK